ncbi:MAG: stage III sporulation protein AF [Lachnospiraceae bacterium]|nr:stage III sporulation protein AF [Lachnospiraceae bacterium]
MEALISYAKSILFFLLFVNLIMQLLKGSSYEKFVRPVCGMILVILIVKPVLSLFGMEEQLLFAAEQKISLLFSEGEAEFVVPEGAGYEFSVLEAYEEELIGQLGGLLSAEGLFLVTADFSLSAEENTFGEIRGITVEAGVGTKTEQQGARIEIAPIVFEKEATEDSMSAEEIRIKDKLADFYNLERENIYVSIKEETDG